MARSDMAKPPKGKKKPKEPVRMTDDEIMDDLFSPKVRKELKKLAEKHRKEPKSKRLTDCP